MKRLLNYSPQLLMRQKSIRRVLTIGLCSCVSVGMYANILADEVSLTCKNKTLKQALEIIEEQAGVSIVYSNNVLNDEARVTCKTENVTLEEMLHILLKDQNCSFKVEDGQVVLYALNDKNTEDTGPTVTQEGFRVKGRVLDANGPLIGVNIMVKGTMTGVVSDMDGNFEIMAPYSGASLVFSYIGYQAQEVKINGRSDLTIKMVEDSKALEEVVVVGYTTQKKATITGSVSTITTKDLKQSPTANLNNALAGLI